MFGISNILVHSQSARLLLLSEAVTHKGKFFFLYKERLK